MSWSFPVQSISQYKSLLYSKTTEQLRNSELLRPWNSLAHESLRNLPRSSRESWMDRKTVYHEVTQACKFWIPEESFNAFSMGKKRRLICLANSINLVLRRSKDSDGTLPILPSISEHFNIDAIFDAVSEWWSCTALKVQMHLTERVWPFYPIFDMIVKITTCERKTRTTSWIIKWLNRIISCLDNDPADLGLAPTT